MLAEIAKYDWAVEGFPAPAGVTLTRKEATDKRNALVASLKEKVS